MLTDSVLPKQSSLLLCPGQANKIYKGANHSNIDSLRMNVQCDLACDTRFQSCLHIYGSTQSAESEEQIWPLF